jgi:sulfur carrier protein
MKKLVVNGKLIDIQSETVDALLRELGIPLQGVAIAVNNEIIPRAEHINRTLSDDDQIEIIRPIGGG